MKIYITRHGQVCPKIYEGSVDFPTGDIPLTETGKAQAVCLGTALKNLNFSGKIYASPYRRTMMTANLVSMECGKKIYPHGSLREMFFSEETGSSFLGMDLLALKKEFSNISEDAILEYPWWTKNIDTLEEIVLRLKNFWDAVLAEQHTEFLAVGHGASVFGSMHYFNQKYGFGFPSDLKALGDFLATRNLNCNLSCIEIDENGNFLSAEMFNTMHLEDKLLSSNSNAKPRPSVISF